MLTQLLLTLALLRPAPGPAAPPKVYLCQGSASYAYHVSTRCEGLAWCTTSPKALSRAAAVKLGRRPCGRCAYQK